MASGASTSSMALATTNSMVAIDEKKTPSVELYYPVRYHFLVHYSDAVFQNLVTDLQTLNTLRSVVEDPRGSLTRRRHLLITYFKALCSAASILPFSPHPDDINAVLFTWFGAFNNNISCSQPSLDLEKASVIFNLGAVYSQIGLSSDRSTTEGIKQAADNFLGAATAFAYLRDHLAPKVAGGGGEATVDLSVDCASALGSLMLAQARECFYENSIANGSTHGVCAVISTQVFLYYKEAYDRLIVVPLVQHFDKISMTQIFLKMVIFRAESCFRHSLELHEKGKIGEEIATLKTGISDLPDEKKISTLDKGQPVQLLVVALNKLRSNLSNNLRRAMEENQSVYHQRVPANLQCFSSLTTLPAGSLPKPIPMDEVLDASKGDLFAHVVLDTRADASPEVEKRIGLLAKKLQVGSEIAEVRLKKMRLPESIVYLEEIATLQEELIAEVEAVQISGGPAELEANLQQLIQSKRVNQELLVQIEEMLQSQVQEDNSLFTKTFRDRVKEIDANLQQADSEEEIKRSLKEHSTLMSTLDPQRIEGDLEVPLLVKPFMSFDTFEAATIGALRQSLSQLDNVRVRRLGHEDMLKEIKTKDDILPELNEQDFDKINFEISENFAAEHKLLERIKAQNEGLLKLFKIEDFKDTYKKWNEQIRAALAKYKEIKENINKGLKIYRDYQDMINDLKQQCHDYVMSRNSEGKEIISSMAGQKRRQVNTYYETSQSTFREPTVNEYRKPTYPGARNSGENEQPPASDIQPPHLSPPS